PGDFASHARQQASLLRAAAALVSPGGRLVYSTCSLDAEENEQVVEGFIASAGGLWTLEAQARSRPWETGTDGAGAFRLRRRA
ncbi:MAG TPA: RNA methyltransferase, partial [Opitutaceae bacterium]|nr:RNA methyltransferase [Opitutaceae bacterium]